MTAGPFPRRPYPLAHVPAWRRVRDAALHVLFARNGVAAPPAVGERAEERFLRALAAVDVPSDARLAALQGLHDLGADLGRHVYSKRILEDSFADGLTVVAENLANAGIATLEVQEVFYRTARLGLVPTTLAASVDEELLVAFVAGACEGALGEAFNCEVTIEPSGPGGFRLVLGEGNDVNWAGNDVDQEVSHSAG